MTIDLAKARILFDACCTTEAIWETEKVRLVKVPGATILAFKGTVCETSMKGVSDWLTNFEIEMVPWKEGHVHKGFLNHYLSIADDILTHLYGEENVWLTGYSQGGAVAGIATSEFPDLFQGIYTFEAPRFCDIKYAEMVGRKWGQKYVRIEMDDDIVPHVPFLMPDFGFLEDFYNSLLARAPLLMQELIKTSTAYAPCGELFYHSDGLWYQGDEENILVGRLLRLCTAGRDLYLDHEVWNVSYNLTD